MIIRILLCPTPYIYRSIPSLFYYSFPNIYSRLLLTLRIRPTRPAFFPFRFIPDTSAYTPEGSLEAFAEALFYRYRLDILYEGEAEYTPLTKDKAGRRDG